MAFFSKKADAAPMGEPAAFAAFDAMRSHVFADAAGAQCYALARRHDDNFWRIEKVNEGETAPLYAGSVAAGGETHTAYGPAPLSAILYEMIRLEHGYAQDANLKQVENADGITVTHFRDALAHAECTITLAGHDSARLVPVEGGVVAEKDINGAPRGEAAYDQGVVAVIRARQAKLNPPAPKDLSPALFDLPAAMPRQRLTAEARAERSKAFEKTAAAAGSPYTYSSTNNSFTRVTSSRAQWPMELQRYDLAKDIVYGESTRNFVFSLYATQLRGDPQSLAAVSEGGYTPLVSLLESAQKSGDSEAYTPLLEYLLLLGAPVDQAVTVKSMKDVAGKAALNPIQFLLTQERGFKLHLLVTLLTYGNPSNIARIINAADPVYGLTPLQHAMHASPADEFAALLLSAGADPCLATEAEDAPLVAAASSGQKTVVSMMLKSVRGQTQQSALACQGVMERAIAAATAQGRVSIAEEIRDWLATPAATLDAPLAPTKPGATPTSAYPMTMMGRF